MAKSQKQEITDAEITMVEAPTTTAATETTKEEAVTWLTAAITNVKTFLGKVWYAIANAFEQAFTLEDAKVAYGFSFVVALGYQIGMAFMTSGMSLIMAPIAIVYDTAVIGAMALVGDFVARAIWGLVATPAVAAWTWTKGLFVKASDATAEALTKAQAAVEAKIGSIRQSQTAPEMGVVI